MTTRKEPALDAAAGRWGWRRFVAVAGPGLIVMLADSDAGSLVTAAESGARWGYRLLPLQLLLIPVLYFVQELAVRLGVATRQGFAELIRARFGAAAAAAFVAVVVASCFGALLTELSGLAGVGALVGAPAALTLALTAALLLAMAATGRYLTVERIALAVGAFELVFLIVAWRARPSFSEIVSQSLSPPLADREFLYLACANIGAVVTPWMVCFQQDSVVERGLSADDLGAARLDTALGAAATQLVMAAVLVAAAATLGTRGGAGLDSVAAIAGAITPFLGGFTGKLLFGLGMAGASLVAAIVVLLTMARTLAAAFGAPHGLDRAPREAPWFYGVYAVALIAGAGIVLSRVDLVALSVAVQAMNALLLPLVLGFLFLLARNLPRPHRLEGRYGRVAAGATAAALALAAISGAAALWK